MSTLSAFLGVAGLGDVGISFFDSSETIIGARSTSGIVDAGSGYYSVSVAVPSTATSVRWNSSGTPAAAAREYFDARLANLDAAVSSRSTYAGADTAGTTTLLSRLTGTRAGLLDNLDAAVSSRSTFAGGAVASVTAPVTVGTNNDKTGYTATATNFVAAPTPSQIAAVILATPANLLVTNASGYVTTSNPATGGSTVTEATIWGYGSRSLTDKSNFSGTATNFSAAPPAADVASAVWSAGTRSLTTFGTLVADVASAVWSATTRTLSAFGFSVSANNLPSDYQQRGTAVTLPATLPAVTLAAAQPNYAPAKASDVQVTVQPAAVNVSGGFLAADRDKLGAIQLKTDQLAFTGGKVEALADVDTSGLEATVPQALTDSVAAILTQVQQLGPDQPISVYSPVATDGSITIVRGYDMRASEGRQIDRALPQSIAAGTVATLVLRSQEFGAVQVLTGAVVIINGQSYARFELTKTASAGLRTTLRGQSGRYQVAVTLPNTHEVLEVTGALTITD